MNNNKYDSRAVADDYIVELYWNRDEQAIEITDKKYGKYLYKIAYNIVRNSPDSEECLNDAYFGVWNRIPPTRPNIFRAFISRITRNIAVDKFRASNAKHRTPSELVLSTEELDSSIGDAYVDRDLEMGEIVRILNEYLRSLSERSAAIFICRYYYADRVADIASMLEVSKSAVYRELESLREGLERALREEGITV